MTHPAIKDELLDRGLDDMLQLSEIAGVVRRHKEIALTESAVVSPTLEVIRELLDSAYVIAGNVVKDEEGILMVQSWGLRPGETIARIEKEWRELGHPITVGDVVWLELSDAGRDKARKERQTLGRSFAG
jgi:hypothetical protein